jgi:CBS domain-containing protein
VVLPADARRQAIAGVVRPPADGRKQQRLYPVVDSGGRLAGVVTRQALADWLAAPPPAEGSDGSLADITNPKPVVAHADDPLRLVAFRMAEAGVTRVPVVKRSDGTFIGMLALHDLLTARTRILDAEQRRERIFDVRLRVPRLFGGSKTAA